MSIDLSQITRRVLANVEDLRFFLAAVLASDDLCIGFDEETDSRPFPDTTIAGFSLYHRPQQLALYVPLRHEAGGNFEWADILPILQRLFDTCTVVAHGWQFDGPAFVRDGGALEDVACTLTLSNHLQARNAGLKDQVLEYRIVSYKDVIAYPALIKECRGFTFEQLDKEKDNPDIWGFHKIDYRTSERAVQYACDDAIWCRELHDVLVREHNDRVGNPMTAAIIRQANNATAALLATAAAEGYVVDSGALERYVELRQKEVSDDSDWLVQTMIQGCWPDDPAVPAPPPTPTAQDLPSLFE